MGLLGNLENLAHLLLRHVHGVWASSSGVGLTAPFPASIWREIRLSLLMVSIMCTGIRMVRAWSAIERVMAWRIHPRRVGRELVSAPVFEFVHRFHKPDVALLDEIQELQAPVGVFLGNRNDQAQIGLDHLLLGNGSPWPRRSTCRG